MNQLNALSGKAPEFPRIKDRIYFGSFARRTKIRPLSDIDLMIVFEALDTSTSRLQTFLDHEKLNLKITDKNSQLKVFEDKSGCLNSTNLVNKLVSSLRYVANYQKAEISRDQQAAVLNLASYNWKFDIVPAFEVLNFSKNKVSYYIIPDGKGKWMKTDSRVDANTISRLNQKHNKMFLLVFRLLKYWNGFDFNKQVLGSYYFEALVSKVFEPRTEQIKTFPEAVRYFFKKGSTYLMKPCFDPKEYGALLDANVDPTVKQKIDGEMKKALFLCDEVIKYEEENRHREAILLWHIIFGSEFPIYG